ncbi:Ig-like domain-containing protein [Herbiconiux sp. 11R-BC]|uniref:Ig-like domain-containing protein n=1 Tax=Herbiconiux sp. 11R-BC TaxID=3111637 RepID=UPI003BFA92B7
MLTDTAGHSASVNAGDPRWGNALHMSTGTVTPSTHIVLEQIRVPLTEFAGVDVSSLASLQLQFGVDGTPASGSIQVADVRFQEKATDAPLILSDGTALDQGAGYGPPATGPNPADVLAAVNVTPGEYQLADTTANPWSNTTLVVDDDKQQCPNAGYTTIQSAVDFAAPWDTIVVCDGTYQERSTPVNSPRVPVAPGALNGLTINKPLKIKGVGADRVTIMPDQTLATLAGTTPYLRDGGGNVITVSRQSLGSTDTNEMFLDISGVTVTSGSTFAEAGIAFFNTAGRVSNSVVGPLRTAQDPTELAANPHGWGIVKAGFLRGAGKGTVSTELTVANSQVSGYQSGGILFDGGYGADGAAGNTDRAGLIQHGYVSGSVIAGSASSLFPQVGVSYTEGFDGFIADSAITGNVSAAAPASSVGVKLSDAATETAKSVEIRSSAITGNGIGVANLDKTSTAPREAAPVTVRGSFVNGTSSAFSGVDSTSTPSVRTLDPVLSAPASVPSAAGSVTDAAPSSQVVDPGAGLTLEVGDTVKPLVKARDDFAVKSVTLLADGVEVATNAVSPYTFEWAAGEADAGKTVSLTAVVTDASGQTTESDPVDVAVAAIDVPPTTPPTTEPTAPATVEPTTPATTAPVATDGAEPPAAAASGDLARTGAAITSVVVIGALLLFGGVLLVVLRRRKQRA